jgi:hypothetical protein
MLRYVGPNCILSLNGQKTPQPSFNVTIKNNLVVGTNGIGNLWGGTVRLHQLCKPTNWFISFFRCTALIEPHRTG